MHLKLATLGVWDHVNEASIPHIQSNLSYLDSCYPGTSLNSTGQLILSIIANIAEIVGSIVGVAYYSLYIVF